jgi:Fic family protein
MNERTVYEALASHPEGVGVHALAEALPHIPRRTLQRVLAALVDNGQVVRQGKGPATLYLPAEPARPTPAMDDYASYIPLSDTSVDLVVQLRRPLAARLPAAYEREWLEAYAPNRTFYLDEHTRGLLHRIGDTGLNASPVGTYGRQMLDRLLIDLSWASSQLEGNTYSPLDTERLILHGEEAAGKDAMETQMILNHKYAIEMLVEMADDVGFNHFTLLNLHGLLSENLLPDPTASGRLRQREVNIGGSVYKPSAIPQVIDDCFDLLLRKADSIVDPFEQAFFVLVHLPYLQPFEDVNKRTARIGANIAFIRHNLCPLTFVEVPERAYVESMLAVYERRRTELLRDVFVWAYERSAQRYVQVKKTLAEPEPLRLKYRQQLHQLVGDIVRAEAVPYTAMVEDYAQRIDAADRPLFVAMALEDIRRLHEGVLVRYRLTPAQLRVWRKKQRP